MKRSAIIKKYSFVLPQMPPHPNVGDCWELQTPLKKLILEAPEGKSNIYYMKCVSSELDDFANGEVNIELIIDEIYISPTEY